MDGVQCRLTSCTTPSLLIQFHLQSSSHIVCPHFLTDEGQSSHSFPRWTKSTLTELSPSRASCRRRHIEIKVEKWQLLTCWHGHWIPFFAAWLVCPGELISLAVRLSSHKSGGGSHGDDASLKLNKWGRGTREGQRFSTDSVFRSTEADKFKL